MAPLKLASVVKVCAGEWMTALRQNTKAMHINRYFLVAIVVRKDKHQ